MFQRHVEFGVFLERPFSLFFCSESLRSCPFFVPNSLGSNMVKHTTSTTRASEAASRPHASLARARWGRERGSPPAQTVLSSDVRMALCRNCQTILLQRAVRRKKGGANKPCVDRQSNIAKNSVRSRSLGEPYAMERQVLNTRISDEMSVLLRGTLNWAA